MVKIMCLHLFVTKINNISIIMILKILIILLMEKKTLIYPVLPLRDLVMFPKMIAPLFIGRESSIRALESIDRNDAKILFDSTKRA